MKRAKMKDDLPRVTAPREIKRADLHQRLPRIPPEAASSSLTASRVN